MENIILLFILLKFSKIACFAKIFMNLLYIIYQHIFTKNIAD